MRPLALACLLVLVGCDRVPIEVDRDVTLTLDTNLDVVQTEPDFTLRLIPDSPDGRLTVVVRGEEVAFDAEDGAFVYRDTLERGLNTFPLTVDDGQTTRRDTLYVVHLPARTFTPNGTNDGVPRTEAASVPLGEDRGLVTGGFGPDDAPLASATVFRLLGSRVTFEEIPLRLARAGHTATPVAGGTLLLGGATTAAPAAAGDFVRQPEWVGPDGTSRLVEVDAGPARSGHVARALDLDGTTYVYLLGGRTPSGPASSTLDVYRVDGADGGSFTLTRLSPPGGASGFAALAALALAPTGPTTAAAFGLGPDGDGVALALRWSTPGSGAFPFSLGVRPAAPLATSRTDAAAVDLGDGLALVTGGRDVFGVPIGGLEVVAAEVDRAFRFPDNLRLAVPRSGHTATIFDGGRIVIISGGRPANGQVIAAYEALLF